MPSKIHKLDNPVFNSLSETHQAYVENCNGMKFYQTNYTAFGGFDDISQTTKGIDQYAQLAANDFYVVGEQPKFSNLVQLNKNVVCHQMVLEQPIKLPQNEVITQLESPEQLIDLHTFIKRFYPSFFKSKTPDLGSYFGIYKQGELVAVTGERMKMNNFTEVSAVITHTAHTRKGYSKQLICHTTNKIFSENKQPYLHVSILNKGAVKLYETLGFTTRRNISFWHFTKV